MAHGNHSLAKSKWMEHTTWKNGHNSNFVKKQYLALLGAVATQGEAHDLMEDLIVWPNTSRPPKHLVLTWEMEWALDKAEAPENEIKKMRQRIRAYHEGLAWQTLRSSLKTTRALSKKAEDGELDAAKQVQLQYSGLTSTYFLKEIANSFGTPKPTPTQIQQININAGPPPKRVKAGKPAQIIAPVIDAEFSEVPIDDSG